MTASMATNNLDRYFFPQLNIHITDLLEYLLMIIYSKIKIIGNYIYLEKY